MALRKTLYHCECGVDPVGAESDVLRPPLSLYEYHDLPRLYFCEECDAIKCADCITEEVSLYYCPLCMFEVPTASVRSESHRCARNCFLCPVCSHTLAIAGSDPELAPDDSLLSPASSVGEAPFFLSCLHCRWTSKEVDITFEKSTGLALQLQKSQPPPPETLEFDHLKDHFEPFVKANTAADAPQHLLPASTSYRTGLTSLPSKYGSLMNLANRARTSSSMTSLSAKTLSVISKDEIQRYESLTPSSQSQESENNRVQFMKSLSSLDEVTSLDQRSFTAWQQPLRVSSLSPQRVPLQAKRTKRCAACKHILLKSESKSASTKFKIRSVAAHYVPTITAWRRPPISSLGTSRLSVAGSAASIRSKNRASLISGAVAEDETLRPGRSYSFELAFVNPLFEPIHVKVEAFKDEKLSMSQSTSTAPPFTFSLPAGQFPVAAHAEQWELEDAQADASDMDSGDGDPTDRRGSTLGGRSKKRFGAGILEKIANRTTILLELAINKDYMGPVVVYLLVTYIYSAEDTLKTTSETPDSANASQEATKSFSFWACVKLGDVVSSNVAARSRIVSQPVSAT